MSARAVPNSQLQRDRPESERLADRALEVADVGLRDLPVHEQRERRRIAGALDRVQHLRSPTRGLALLGVRDYTVDIAGWDAPVILGDRVLEHGSQLVDALARERGDLEHRRVADERQLSR